MQNYSAKLFIFSISVSSHPFAFLLWNQYTTRVFYPTFQRKQKALKKGTYANDAMLECVLFFWKPSLMLFEADDIERR